MGNVILRMTAAMTISLVIAIEFNFGSVSSGFLCGGIYLLASTASTD